MSAVSRKVAMSALPMWWIIRLSTWRSRLLTSRRFSSGADEPQQLQRAGRLPQHGRQPRLEPVRVSRERLCVVFRWLRVALRFPLRRRASWELFRNLETPRRCCTRASLLRAASLTMLRMDLERLRAWLAAMCSKSCAGVPAAACCVSADHPCGRARADFLLARA